jgi:hypothetical protein
MHEPRSACDVRRLRVIFGSMVRRLPVVQNPSPEDEVAERRPPWQWTLIGAGLAITIWLPLLAVALWVAARLGAAASPGARIAATILPIVLAFGASTLAAGAMVGRFGGRSSEREALLSGALAAVVACVFAVLGGSTSAPAIAAAGGILVITGSVTAWLGARLGRRARPRV